MRDLMECKAEVLRRSESRIKERAARRARILAVCIPLCFVFAVCSIIALPQIMTDNANGSFDGQKLPTATVGGHYGNSNGSNNGGNQIYGDASNKGENQTNGNGNGASNGSDDSDDFPDSPDSNGDSALPPWLDRPVNLHATNLMASITSNRVNVLDNLGSQNAAVTDFALRLFRASEKNSENTLISPLSVLCALSMTANGAEEETLREMEAVLGMTKEELNLYLYSYVKSLPQDEKYKLSLANSIWLTEDERFSVNRDFLQTVADYYGADIYKAPFNNQTLRDINNWVKQKTDKMIPKVLDEISPETVMCLINALAFDAEWSDMYCELQVQDGKFTREDGVKQDAEFMYSSESTYLEDDNATGFIKYYKRGKYAFVALLPKENVSVSEYIATLDGESLHKLLSNPQRAEVDAAIPKFECEYGVEMSNILKGMGMIDAFDANNADFDGLGNSENGNICIGQVIHKTYISVAEQGTKAGAATVVTIPPGAAPGEPEVPKQVYLDRPFVYMLIDCENNIPFFIGTMTDIEK